VEGGSTRVGSSSLGVVVPRREELGGDTVEKNWIVCRPPFPPIVRSQLSHQLRPLPSPVLPGPSSAATLR
jgi:hypothetical protein